MQILLRSVRGLGSAILVAALFTTIEAHAGWAPRAADGPPVVDHLATDRASDVLATTIRRVERAYRPDGDAFVARQPDYRIRYTTTGQLELRPRPARRGESVWRVRTRSIGRGGLDLLRTDPVLRRTPEGALLIDHGGVHEKLENRREGVEQSWIFEGEPAGKGDLRIEIRFVDALLARHDESGLSFVHARDDGSSLHYGEAVWIDAHGNRTTIAPVVEGDRVSLVVPETLLARSSWPAVLDPILSPEFPITDPVATPPDFDHVTLDAAWGADGLLATWQKSLPGVIAPFVETVLVTPDGKPSNRKVAFENWSGFPRISFDRTNYLVVYKSGIGSANTDVFARRVDPNGILVDSVPHRISFQGGVFGLATAWGGKAHVVAWAESADGGVTFDIRAARVGSDGVVIDVPSLAVGVDPLTTGWPSVACDPVALRCLIVWSQDLSVGANEIRARTLDLHAEPGTELGPIRTLAVGIDPNVVFDGTRYAIVYEAAGASGIGLRVVRTDGAGSPIDDLVVLPASGTSRPAIAWDGTQYLISWTQLGSNEIAATRMTTAGVLLDPTPLVLAPGAFDGRLTAGGGFFFSVSSDHSRYDGFGPNVGDASLRRVAPDGSLPESGPIDLTPHSNEQTHAAIAFDGLDYLVVWEDLRSQGGADVYAARVTPRGDVLDPAGIPVGAQPGTQRDPDVDFDGNDFLVVWTDEQGNSPTIRGARVAIDGSIVDASPRVLSGTGADSPGRPAVAWNGSHHLVVWEDFRNKGTTSNVDIYGARLTSTLASLDPLGIGIATELTSGGVPGALQNNEMSPDVASRAGNWLVVWRDTGSADFDIASRVVSSTGSLAGSGKVPISTAANAQQAPAVAASDTGYLVVWEDQRSNVVADVYASRLTDAGAVIDPAGIPLVAGNWPATSPAVSWNGSQYIAAWRDGRGSPAAIYATSIGTDGVVGQLDGSQIGVGFDEDRPALASHGSATSLLVSERFVNDYPFFAMRIHGRFSGDCGDGLTGPGEQCDDANPIDGDGCSALCRNEDERTLFGLASGGTARVVIGGVVVEVATSAGETPAQVVAALADAIRATLSLHTQGIGALALGDRIVVEGVIASASTTDPGLSFTPPPPTSVPGFTPIGRLLLVLVLMSLGGWGLMRFGNRPDPT